MSSENMAEIQLTRIKSIYGDLKGFLSQIPLSETNNGVNQFLVRQLNQIVDNLTNLTDTDFSTYKVPDNTMFLNWLGMFPTDVVRAQLGRIISRLENEYGFSQPNQSNSSSGIFIFNKNNNEISLQINYTIKDLINEANDKESKDKLNELNTELDKSNKDWGKIKDILIWILNFSKEFKKFP